MRRLQPQLVEFPMRRDAPSTARSVPQAHLHSQYGVRDFDLRGLLEMTTQSPNLSPVMSINNAMNEYSIWLLTGSAN